MKTKICLVVSQFNAEITSRLQEAAVQVLVEEGNIPRADIEIFHVPGAFEIPVTVATAAQTKVWDAIVTLGCLIQGDTPHFEYISQSVTHALDQIAIQHQIPVAFGILTTKTWEQAEIRAGLRSPNNDHGTNKRVVTSKGADAARAALSMIDTLRKVRSFERQS